MSEKTKNNNGNELAPLSPGWIKKRVPDSYADDVLKELILFYVINTPVTDLSSSGIPITDYGWNKDVWKKGKLKKELFRIANIQSKKTFFVAKKTNEMKKACKKASLSKGFHKNRDHERIVVYKGRYSEFLCICYHIRNAFAHGRLAMYDCDNNKDVMFVLEDGVKKQNKFQVRSRMILRKSTLKKWMDIIKSGQLTD